MKIDKLMARYQTGPKTPTRIDPAVDTHGGMVGVLDIERFPNLSAHYDRRTSYIGIDKTVVLSRMASAQFGWLHDDEVTFVSEFDFKQGRITKPAKKRMLKQVWDFVDRADVLIGHNIDRFDIKHLRTEWLLAGMGEPSPVKTVDTYKVIKTRLNLESNSLRHACELLGLPLKGDSLSMEQMVLAMFGDTESWELLRDYAVQDIPTAKALYRRLIGHMPNHPYVGDTADNTARCNQCGSEDLVRNGSYRAVVQDYAAYLCSNCGGHARAGIVRRTAHMKGVQ